VLLSPVMADSDANLGKEGEPISAVDPAALKRMWNLKTPWSMQALQEACGPGGDISAVSRRHEMIRTLTHFKVVTPWQHGEELDDAVFRIAAIFPMHELSHRNYRIEGDEIYGFDPNAFLQQLVNETGISHFWEPIETKISEGGFMYSGCSATFKGQVPNPEREAKRQARDLLWEIWKRFAPSLDDVISHGDKKHASHVVATFFADFLMDNIDLVRQVEDGFRKDGFPQLATLRELEQKAQRGSFLGS
jgi:hypothetical protein